MGFICHSPAAHYNQPEPANKLIKRGLTPFYPEHEEITQGDGSSVLLAGNALSVKVLLPTTMNKMMFSLRLIIIA
jgi:hypothetical protein